MSNIFKDMVPPLKRAKWCLLTAQEKIEEYEATGSITLLLEARTACGAATASVDEERTAREQESEPAIIFKKEEKACKSMKTSQ